jgi:hypothetical protein
MRPRGHFDTCTIAQISKCFSVFRNVVSFFLFFGGGIGKSVWFLRG